ncbi:MAG TPA: anthranilate phosphoribosyltransferase [Abditibacteriaceae bacterium]|jgi:anthranilate phosphoribosyltransferase
MSESTVEIGLKEALKKVTNGDFLSRDEASSVMNEIMSGEASPVVVAALVGALKMRGETVDEITGFAQSMRARAVRVETTAKYLVDTCGTGGDAPSHGIATFNISTAAAIIAAAAGATVAKHGNRAMSSKCGSADVLEELGVNLKLSPERIGQCIDTVGIGFMFAQDHHPAMKHVAPIRRELGIRTIFNLLGPLVNPAMAGAQVLGVSDERWLMPIAQVLRLLGTKHAIVCHSEDGMDEFSTCAPTRFIQVKKGFLSDQSFNPLELGLSCADAKVLEGGDAQTNAAIIQQLLNDASGPTADIACLNAAAVLIAADIAPNFRLGLKLARATVNAGEAREKLARLVEFTNAG